MTWRTRFLGLALCAMSGALMAQQATSEQSTTTTTTTTKTVTGSVVQYSPGQSIVVRGSDGKATTYTLGPELQVPSDVQIGRSVTILTQPGANGGQAVVTRVEVKAANPSDSSSPSSSSTQTTTVQSESSPSAPGISGRVTAYQPKQFITIQEAGKRPVTYIIDPQSDLPQDIGVGKMVIITSSTAEGSSKPVVRTVTVTRTTKTSESPQ
jgi:hypothetical protein